MDERSVQRFDMRQFLTVTIAQEASAARQIDLSPVDIKGGKRRAGAGKKSTSQPSRRPKTKKGRSQRRKSGGRSRRGRGS